MGQDEDVERGNGQIPQASWALLKTEVFVTAAKRRYMVRHQDVIRSGFALTHHSGFLLGLPAGLGLAWKVLGKQRVAQRTAPVFRLGVPGLSVEHFTISQPNQDRGRGVNLNSNLVFPSSFRESPRMILLESSTCPTEHNHCNPSGQFWGWKGQQKVCPQPLSRQVALDATVRRRFSRHP